MDLVFFSISHSVLPQVKNKMGKSANRMTVNFNFVVVKYF